MKPRTCSAALITTLLLLTTSAGAQAPAKPHAAAAPTPQADYALPDVTAKKWTGDLDGMIKRRQIRILVPYSKTFYFVDRGTQRGLAYNAGRFFEEDINKTLNTKHIRIHVPFLPISRDELIPGLLEGRGDVAIANLTITPERLKQVDFSDPTRRDVTEIVVTGPGAEPIATVEDLSGKEVYVRRSSSFYESLEKVNADFATAGKAVVKVWLAPENLEIEDILEMVNSGLVKITMADDHMAELRLRSAPAAPSGL
jgi:membrane-bound lytic murein transglycosylase MltF